MLLDLLVIGLYYQSVDRFNFNLVPQKAMVDLLLLFRGSQIQIEPLAMGLQFGSCNVKT